MLHFISDCRYISPNLSAGRVQSCGLFLICQRERERWAFKSSHYYSITAAFTIRNPNKDATVDTQKKSNRNKNALENNEVATDFFEAKLTSLNKKKVAGQEDFDHESGNLKESFKGNTEILSGAKSMTLIRWLTGMNELPSIGIRWIQPIVMLNCLADIT